MLVDYGALMTGNEWAPEEDDSVERKDLKFRAVPWMKDKLIALALVETGVRKIRKTRGVLSVNRMLGFIVERFFVAYEKLNGALPDPKDKSAIADYAAAVAKAREIEERTENETERERETRARQAAFAESLAKARDALRRSAEKESSSSTRAERAPKTTRR